MIAFGQNSCQRYQTWELCIKNPSPGICAKREVAKASASILLEYAFYHRTGLQEPRENSSSVQKGSTSPSSPRDKGREKDKESMPQKGGDMDQCLDLC